MRPFVCRRRSSARCVLHMGVARLLIGPHACLNEKKKHMNRQKESQKGVFGVNCREQGEGCRTDGSDRCCCQRSISRSNECDRPHPRLSSRALRVSFQVSDRASQRFSKRLAMSRRLSIVQPNKTLRRQRVSKAGRGRAHTHTHTFSPKARPNSPARRKYLPT
ncbi:hypothetical protein LZ32DRAFT_295347 [Colletotrichum eremochloae]|nr:hypothetical protein LZ32DRAFT_295347 [Colletotrichum eremochloae]